MAYQRWKPRFCGRSEAFTPCIFETVNFIKTSIRTLSVDKVTPNNIDNNYLFGIANGLEYINQKLNFLPCWQYGDQHVYRVRGEGAFFPAFWKLFLTLYLRDGKTLW